MTNLWRYQEIDGGVYLASPPEPDRLPAWRVKSWLLVGILLAIAISPLPGCVSSAIPNLHIGAEQGELASAKAYIASAESATTTLAPQVPSVSQPLVSLIRQAHAAATTQIDAGAKTLAAISDDDARLASTNQAQVKVIADLNSSWLSPRQKSEIHWAELIVVLLVAGYILVQIAGQIPPPYGTIIATVGHVATLFIGPLVKIVGSVVGGGLQWIGAEAVKVMGGTPLTQTTAVVPLSQQISHSQAVYLTPGTPVAGVAPINPAPPVVPA
jgi:hypothetical protein